MGDKRIRIERCNIDEGNKKIFPPAWLIYLLPIPFQSDMRLRAIEFVQQRLTRSVKFQDVDLAKELKKLFDE